MKKYLSIALVFALVVAFAGCQKGGEEEPSNNAKAAELYGDVLDHIQDYDFDEFVVEKYRYAIVQTEKESAPQLLVEKLGQPGIPERLRIFSMDSETAELIAPEEVLQKGVAGAGGFRGDIKALKSGKGLRYDYLFSGTGESWREKITIIKEGDRYVLDQDTVWHGRFDEAPEDDAIDIVYADIDDRAQLEALAKIPDGEFSNEAFYAQFKTEKDDEESATDTHEEDSQQATDTAQNSLDEQIQAEQNAGKYIAAGTVKHLTHQEVLDLQNTAEPNPGGDYSDLTYDVLVLDTPTTYEIVRGGGRGETYPHEAKILLFSEGIDANYYGQHITISFTVEDVVLPSDTSLPLGEPRVRNYTILG